MSSTPSRAADPGHPRRVTVIVLVICWATIIADGFDVVVFGALVPSLIGDPELGLNPATVGLLGASAIIGMFVGSLLSGAVTDRFGRKRPLIVFVTWFSVVTGLCALAPNVETLGALRFLAGLALGGVLPTASALLAEYSSPKQRNLVYGVLWSGFPVGGILAALAGMAILPAFGWRGMFVLGLVPLVLIVPFAIAMLPESVAFLLARGQYDRAGALAVRHGFSLSDEGAPRAGEAPARASVRALFGAGNARRTVAFWASSFLCLFMIYGINTWLPQIMQSAGHSLGSALAFLLVYNVGAIIGLVSISFLADRFESRRVVISSFLVAATAIALLSVAFPTLVVYALLILAGAGALGTQAFINAWVSKTSPTHIRATALGWSLGIGRLGSVLAPVALGMVVGSDVDVSWNFYTIAIPGLIGAALIAVLTTRASNGGAGAPGDADAQPEVATTR